MNPYTPPNAPLTPGPAAASIDPARAAEIQAQLKSLNLKSFALAIPGFVLQGWGQANAATLVSLLGSALVIGGLVFYARMRGRSPVFAVLGLLSIVGLFILYFLPKGCLNCQTSNSYGAKQCKQCGAPLGS